MGIRADPRLLAKTLFDWLRRGHPGQERMGSGIDRVEAALVGVSLAFIYQVTILTGEKKQLSVVGYYFEGIFTGYLRAKWSAI